MYRQRNNKIYQTVVAVWLTLSIASVVLAALTWSDLSEKLRVARDAVAIQNELDTILLLVVDTETAQRGFTITGDERFLEPFGVAESSLPLHFDHLTELVKQDSMMLNRVVELRTQVEMGLAHHRQVVLLRRTKGTKAATELVASAEGKRIMDNVRHVAKDLRGMRSDLISDGGIEARSQLLRASLTSMVAGVLGVGAGGIAFWLARVMLGHQAREKQLVEEKLRAERSSQEKTAFLANMSHEIRTPMNAILGFSELLGGELREPRQREYLKSIRTSAGSLLQLINDILDMSKIEAGVMELRLEPTDPREICDFLHTVFSEAASKKGVRLECHIAPDLPHALLLDRIRLRQVLVNLVGNAVKFTDQGTIQVFLRWEKQETSSHIVLFIEVQDTGVGIPQDRLEAIFKPFIQAGAHREKEKAGTGLGLSIVRRLTEMMGGTVTAASIMGQGSAFSLRIPNVAVSARLPFGQRLESGRPADFGELAEATILIVDDNETNCQLIAGMFTGTPHHLEFAFSGQEAIQKARELKPDAILMDIRMPGMDGRETLAVLRTVPNLDLTPVIAVTASSLLSEEKELKGTFNGYVRKPFTKRELYDELAQFLPRRTMGTDDLPPEEGRGGELSKEPIPAELLTELGSLLEKEWPLVRDSVAINESRAFADRLVVLAQRHSCRPLETYARLVAGHAATYSVVELEKDLYEFPVLVERLEQESKPKS